MRNQQTDKQDTQDTANQNKPQNELEKPAEPHQATRQAENQSQENYHKNQYDNLKPPKYLQQPTPKSDNISGNLKEQKQAENNHRHSEQNENTQNQAEKDRSGSVNSEKQAKDGKEVSDKEHLQKNKYVNYAGNLDENVARKWRVYYENEIEKQKITQKLESLYPKWNIDDPENPELIYEPSKEDKEEMKRIEDRLAQIKKERDELNKDFEIAKFMCKNHITCDFLVDKHDIDRRELTEMGYKIYEQDKLKGDIDKNWVKFPNYKTIYHQYTPDGKKIDENFPYNKYVDKYGILEVVTNKKGEVIRSKTNAGTFNYGSTNNWLDHIKYDVDPYVDYGNGGDDKTTHNTRRKATLINSPNSTFTENAKATLSTIGSFIAGGDFHHWTKSQKQQIEKSIKMFNESVKRKTGKSK